MGMRIGRVQIIHAATDGLTLPSGSGMAAPTTIHLSGVLPGGTWGVRWGIVGGYDPGYASMQPTLSDSWNSPRNIWFRAWTPWNIGQMAVCIQKKRKYHHYPCFQQKHQQQQKKKQKTYHLFHWPSSQNNILILFWTSSYQCMFSISLVWLSKSLQNHSVYRFNQAILIVF